jgi:hypothetical protein
LWRPGYLMQHFITLLLGQIVLTTWRCVLDQSLSCSKTNYCPTKHEPDGMAPANHHHGGWNQKSHILTHRTKGQISTGLMSIACVSCPNQVFSSYCCSLVEVSLQQFEREGQIHSVSSEQLLLRFTFTFKSFSRRSVT